MSNKVTNQSKYWILELVQIDLIKLGFNPVLIDSSNNPGAGSEPLLRVEQFSIYCDTRAKFTLYQFSFERLLSRVCISKVKKTLLTALAATQPLAQPKLPSGTPPAFYYKGNCPSCD